MPSLSPEEAELLASHAAFVARSDAARLVLEPGDRGAAGGLALSLVSVSRRGLAMGGCGNATGLRAVFRVGEGRCAREVGVGPGPEVVPVGGVRLALAPESGLGRVVLVVG
jgi:hypothetical protein